MKILQICHKPPFPPIDGGCIAINNITQGLIKAGHDVKVLAISTAKHPLVDSLEFKEYASKTHFESVFVDTSLNYFQAFKSLFLRESYHVKRFVSKSFSAKIAEVLSKESYDIIQLESIFVAPYISLIKSYSNAKIVMRLHNIEHLVWERLIQNESHRSKALVLKMMTRNFRRYENSCLKKIDGFMTISEVDYSYFHAQYPDLKGATIPFGVNMDDYENEEEYFPSDKPELFYLGSMNWLPNKEGLLWFLEEVWEKIVEKFPDVTLTIAGRGITEDISKYQSDRVIIVGEVEDAKEFMLSKDIMIVPILSGSGVRVKIIEGMALGKTIITTSVGLEGLDVTDGQNIFVADTPEKFVELIEKCIKTPDLCDIIGENAEHFVTLYHNNDIITQQIIDFYKSILELKK